MKLLLKNGSIVDPVAETIEKKDILIQDSKIIDIGLNFHASDAEEIDLTGRIAAPGFVDIHVHLRDPGLTYKEDITTGSSSAAAGGFTTIVCMPNTKPVIDSVDTVKYIQSTAEKNAPISVLISGAVTKGLQGEELTDMESLVEAGICCLTDDGQPIMNAQVMRSALCKSCELDLPLLSHCEDKDLAHGGVMNEGYISRELGIPGIPPAAEDAMVARDIVLAKSTGGRLHITHLSTAVSLELVRIAKKKGINVTCDVTPHNLILTEETVRNEKTNAVMYPPLRTKKDVDALREGLRDGTIDAIATDHAPHSEEEKSMGFGKAPKGIVGLETALSVCLESLVHNGILTLPQLIRKMTYNPGQIIGLPPQRLEVGNKADITVIDLDYKWKVDKNKFLSKGRNTPFHGWKLKGKPVMTIAGGKIVYGDKEYWTKSVE